MSEAKNTNNEADENVVSNKDMSVEELSKLLEEATSKADANWNEYLRARADLENTRKRSLKDIENARKFSIERMAKELLDVLDSFDQGLEATAHLESKEAASIREGMVLTKKMLLHVLDKFGVKTIELSAGDAFDPAKCEAISMQESSDYAPNTVMAVMQSGYILHERILRPARVVVSREATS